VKDKKDNFVKETCRNMSQLEHFRKPRTRENDTTTDNVDCKDER